MEDYTAWTETFCLYVLLNVVFKNAEVRAAFVAAWRHLRAASLFALRFDEGQHTEANIMEFSQHIREYARICETVRRRYR